MSLTIKTLQSPCVTWKTRLPHMNRSCTSPVFTLFNLESEAKFTLSGCWNKSGEDEQWIMDLTTSKSLGSISIITYIEKNNRELQRFGCCAQIPSNDKYYSSFLYLRRKSLIDGGIREDVLTMVFVFHYSSCTMDIVKDVEYLTNSKKIKLDSSLVGSILEEEKKDKRKKVQKKDNREKLADHTSLLSLSEDIGKLFDKEEHSDAVLKCGDRSFSVSKKILCARSEVFAAMFRHKMSESETGSVDITDMDPSVLEQFLRYLYSARLDGLSMDSVFDLYRAGDKYAIPSLKRKCASFMVDNLSEENVCEILSLAGTFEDAELQGDAISFAVSRPEFLVSDKWTAFAESQPAVAVKVFLRCTKAIIGVPQADSPLEVPSALLISPSPNFLK